MNRPATATDALVRSQTRELHLPAVGVTLRRARRPGRA